MPPAVDHEARHRVEIGTIVLYARGDILNPDHRRNALAVVTEVSRVLEAETRTGLLLVTGELSAPILTVFLDGVEFQPGSLATVAKVATIIGGVAAGLANYDEAREGVAQIMADLDRIAHVIVENAPPTEPDTENGAPIDVSLYTRPAEEIEADLRKLKR